MKQIMSCTVLGATAIALALPRMAGALQVRPSPLAKTESVSRTDVVPPTKPESVTVAASTHYRAGALQRWFAGGTNRDLWATPIRVPVLDWQTYDGGLHPTKEGGGMQTKSLRFETPTGAEYVFRLSAKPRTARPNNSRTHHWTESSRIRSARSIRRQHRFQRPSSKRAAFCTRARSWW